MTINLRAANPKRSMRDLRKFAGAYRVFADGKERPDCFYYDGRRKILGLNKLNEKGQACLDPFTGGIAVEWIKFRRVRLIKK